MWRSEWRPVWRISVFTNISQLVPIVSYNHACDSRGRGETESRRVHRGLTLGAIIGLADSKERPIVENEGGLRDGQARCLTDYTMRRVISFWIAKSE